MVSYTELARLPFSQLTSQDVDTIRQHGRLSCWPASDYPFHAIADRLFLDESACGSKLLADLNASCQGIPFAQLPFDSRGAGPYGPLGEKHLSQAAFDHLCSTGADFDFAGALALLAVSELAVLLLHLDTGFEIARCRLSLFDGALYGRVLFPLRPAVATRSPDGDLAFVDNMKIDTPDSLPQPAPMSAFLDTRAANGLVRTVSYATQATTIYLSPSPVYDEAGISPPLRPVYDDVGISPTHRLFVEAGIATVPHRYEDAAISPVAAGPLATVSASPSTTSVPLSLENERQAPPQNELSSPIIRRESSSNMNDAATSPIRSLGDNDIVWHFSPGDQTAPGKETFRVPTFWQPFGRYLRGDAIGKGAQGKVYRCRDGLTRQEVAVKVSLCPSPGQPPGSVLREIAAIKEASHANIMSLLAVLWGDGDTVALVFPLAQQDLKMAISLRKEKCIDIPIMKLYLQQILAGLAYLHDVLKVVHLDLKPDNILLSSNHLLRIADFGLSRPIGPAGRQRTVVTMTYRAPEVFFRIGHFAPAIDMFALGVIVTEMLCGGAVPWASSASNPLMCFDSMLDYLGCGPAELWPGADGLPGVWHGHDGVGDDPYYLAKKGKLRFRMRDRKVNTLPCRPEKSAGLVKVRNRLLVLDPDERPRAKSLLNKHPVFREEPRVAKLGALPAVEDAHLRVR